MSGTLPSVPSAIRKKTRGGEGGREGENEILLGTRKMFFNNGITNLKLLV